jgi:hypothetical protein
VLAVWDVLLHQQVRAKAGRRARPSVAVIDPIAQDCLKREQRRYDAQTKRSKARWAAAGRAGALGRHSEPDGSRGFTGEAGQACSPLALLRSHWLQQRQRQGQNWR